MRFKHVLRNGIFAAGKQILIILLGLTNRTIFIRFLGFEYLGYTSLFSNILTWLCFAEAGFSIVMEYRLYQANATDDRYTVGSVMKLYKQVYTSLGICMLFVGIAITGLTPLLIRQEDVLLDTFALYKIYWLQLLAVVAGYFGSYWRAFIQAKQEAYLCESADSVISILSLLIQLIALACFQSLYWYLGVKILEVIAKNLLIRAVARKKYPDAVPPDAPSIGLRESGVLHDIKGYFFQKIAYLIYIATDNIVISKFCGIAVVGIYSNYLLLYSNVQGLLFSTPFQMAQASISNFLNSEDEDRKKNLICILDILTAIYSSALCCGFLVCFQPTITLWLGEKALLPFSFVLLLVINTYVSFSAEPLYKIRATYGDYQDERMWMSFSAISNLLFSILFVQKWGVAGVEFGTIIGMLFMAAGRARFVSTHCDFFRLKAYLWKHVKYSLLFVVEAVTAYYLTLWLPATLPGIIGKGLIAVISSVAISTLFLRWTADFQAAYAYLKFQLGALKRHQK